MSASLSGIAGGVSMKIARNGTLPWLAKPCVSEVMNDRLSLSFKSKVSWFTRTVPWPAVTTNRMEVSP